MLEGLGVEGAPEMLPPVIVDTSTVVARVNVVVGNAAVVDVN